jgi:hypothetical protein
MIKLMGQKNPTSKLVCKQSVHQKLKLTTISVRMLLKSGALLALAIDNHLKGICRSLSC